MRRGLVLFILACSGVLACVACGGGGGHAGDGHGGDGTTNGDGAGCGDGSGSGFGTPLTADQIEKACIAATSCDFAGSASKCVGGLADGETLVSEFRPDQIRCLATAGSSCTAALACIGLAITAPCAPEGSTCMGSLYHKCQNATAFDQHCGGGLWYTADSTCVKSGSATGCGAGACTSGASCDGTRAHNCVTGIDTVEDCAVYGMTCATANQKAACVGTGAPCTADRCDGTAWVRCEGGHELRVECATMLDGGTCITGTGGLFCGYANDCSNATPSTCSGKILTTCVLGKQMTFDCSAAGYQSCNGDNCLSLQP